MKRLRALLRRMVRPTRHAVGNYLCFIGGLVYGPRLVIAQLRALYRKGYDRGFAEGRRLALLEADQSTWIPIQTQIQGDN